MFWTQRLTVRWAELKETHLGPLTSTFSRSPSTSTITDKDKSPGGLSGTATPTQENAIGENVSRALAGCRR